MQIRYLETLQVIINSNNSKTMFVSLKGKEWCESLLSTSIFLSEFIFLKQYQLLNLRFRTPSRRFSKTLLLSYGYFCTSLCLSHASLLLWNGLWNYPHFRKLFSLFLLVFPQRNYRQISYILQPTTYPCHACSLKQITLSILFDSSMCIFPFRSAYPICIHPRRCRRLERIIYRGHALGNCESFLRTFGHLH